MKLFHLADLHIGKRVHGFSLLADQREALDAVLVLAKEHRPDAILIAGDVYDASVPAGEAVSLLDEFLTSLARENIPVLLISGNHDSPERLAFLSRIMGQSGIHVSPVYAGDTAPIILTDAHGPVHFYLLPFIKPTQVRRFFEGEEIISYTDAVAAAIRSMNLDLSLRNVLVTHQFVTGSLTCDSEELNIGGADNVDGAVFDPFDYVALGHLHRPQYAYGEKVRYAGSLLKYSFSECRHVKSVTLAELGPKGSLNVATLPIVTGRDMREIKGSWAEVTSPLAVSSRNPMDYLRITLTEEEEVPDAMARLRSHYPNLMRLDYDNQRTRQYQAVSGAVNPEQKTPLALFEELYELQNNQPMSPEQREFVIRQINLLWEEQA